MNAVAVDSLPSHRDARIQLAEDFIEPRRAAEDGRFPADDACPGPARIGNELRCQVAAADIFSQCGLHVVADFKCQIHLNSPKLCAHSSSGRHRCRA